VSATSILSTRALRWDVGGATIVADVSLDVPEGECLGIIGPNGAGKTSLFNLLSGLIRPTGGEVVLAGREITDDPPYRRTQAGLGRTFQVSSVFPLLTVLENARLAAEAAAGGTMRIWGGGVGGRVRVRLRSPRLEVADSALARVGLAGRARALAGSLSHGDKRKLELAMLLAADKRVILLDEPMAGVSAEDVEGLVDLIGSVHREEGRTVLMVEHHMEVVTGLADRIGVMHHGTLLACDTPQAIMANETVQEAYLGEPL
jgi:branched-chain amino acid transport system ATP-binding protein